MKKSILKKIVYSLAISIFIILIALLGLKIYVNSRDEALFYADAEKAKVLINAGADVNTRDEYGRTPLFSADAEKAKVLINAGADVNTRDEYGRTPLFSANAETAARLIKAGADVNARDRRGETPLFSANTKKTEVLIKAGADVNLQDNKGWTALMYAKKIEGEDSDLYNYLVEHGADTTIKNNDDQTVFEIVYKPLLYGKPILYFYPPEEIQVNVVLKNEQALTHTYPKYSQSWNVLAKPDGSLYDVNGRYYYALYWEGAEENKPEPEDGFIVKGSDTIPFLEEKLPLLGLNEREMNEFIIYWLPKLEQDGYNLIRFATMEEQNEYMPLEITPKPDTLIRVKMEFWHLDDWKNVTEQVLPPTPERKGFVVVEWGGVDR